MNPLRIFWTGIVAFVIAATGGLGAALLTRDTARANLPDLSPAEPATRTGAKLGTAPAVDNGTSTSWFKSDGSFKDLGDETFTTSTEPKYKDGTVSGHGGAPTSVTLRSGTNYGNNYGWGFSMYTTGSWGHGRENGNWCDDKREVLIPLANADELSMWARLSARDGGNWANNPADAWGRARLDSSHYEIHSSAKIYIHDNFEWYDWGSGKERGWTWDSTTVNVTEMAAGKEFGGNYKGEWMGGMHSKIDEVYVTGILPKFDKINVTSAGYTITSTTGGYGRNSLCAYTIEGSAVAPLSETQMKNAIDLGDYGGGLWNQINGSASAPQITDLSPLRYKLEKNPANTAWVLTIQSDGLRPVTLSIANLPKKITAGQTNGITDEFVILFV